MPKGFGRSYVGQKMVLNRLHSFCIMDFIVYLHNIKRILAYSAKKDLLFISYHTTNRNICILDQHFSIFHKTCALGSQLNFDN